MVENQTENDMDTGFTQGFVGVCNGQHTQKKA